MRLWFTRIALVLTLTWSGVAQANALSDSWNCAKASGNLAIKSQTDLYKKAEAMASKAGPLSICLAKTGPEGQALIATSSALTALRLAKPSLLPKGQCESRIKGLATKPFANGIAALLPAGAVKNNLVSAANSETANAEVWNQIGQLPPPFSSVPNQIECGCLISDGALTLTDISEITNAIAGASSSCASMLDSLGLGFINDIGSYAGKLAKSLASGASGQWDEIIGGQSDPGPPGAVFEMFYGQNLEGIAINMAKYPNDWQGKPYFNHQGWKCNYNMNSGQWEGQCSPSFGQIYDLCVDYYDNHKMSASNAKKTCNSYRETLLAAATPKAKQYAAIAALPELYYLTVGKMYQDNWMWRYPTTYSPGYYDFDNGNVSKNGKDGPLIVDFSDDLFPILGNRNINPTTAKAGEKYKAVGALATAQALVVEVGNDPEKALALAYASTITPMQDVVRKSWDANRKGVGYYNLREWYPKPTFGFRYGCSSSEIEAACAAAMEAKFDKMCFTPLSELYVTGQLGFGFPARFTGVKNKCGEQLAPILAAASKLDAGMVATIEGACTERATRDEQSSCNAAARKTYYECAAVALKQGKDNASQCLAGRKLGADILKQIQKGSKPPAATPPRKP